MTIAEQINAVVQAREKAKEMADKGKALYDDFIAQHTEFFAEVVVAATAATEAEKELREEALLEYGKTGNKAVAPGVGIRVLTRLVYDNKTAMDWAIEHSLALALDKKAFESIAVTTDLDFVVAREEPIATIATELKPVNP